MKIIIISEVTDFVESLEDSTIAKVLRTIDLLEEFGQELGMPHSRPMGKGLFELRVRGKQEIRLLYGFNKRTVHIVHGFLKKTQTTPVREHKLARQRLDEI